MGREWEARGGGWGCRMGVWLPVGGALWKGAGSAEGAHGWHQWCCWVGVGCHWVLLGVRWVPLGVH